MKITYMHTFETSHGLPVDGSGWNTRLIITKDTESAVRAELARGDYSEGGPERIVHVKINGKHWGKYSAPRIRKFQNK